MNIHPQIHSNWGKMWKMWKMWKCENACIQSKPLQMDRRHTRQTQFRRGNYRYSCLHEKDREISERAPMKRGERREKMHIDSYHNSIECSAQRCVYFDIHFMDVDSRHFNNWWIECNQTADNGVVYSLKYKIFLLFLRDAPLYSTWSAALHG